MSVKPMIDTAPKAVGDLHVPKPGVKTGFPPNFGAEAMIQWLYSQMRTSNKDVQSTLAEVEASRGKLNTLSKLQQGLRDLKASCAKSGDETRADLSKDSLNLSQYQTSETVPVDSTVKTIFGEEKGGPFGPETTTTMTTKVGVDKGSLEKQDWYQALSPEGKAAVEKFIMQLNKGDNVVLEKQLDAVLDKVKDDISSLNSNNELQMINLQHVMQTRNQAIQLSSNIISVLDRGADTAINNIGKG